MLIQPHLKLLSHFLFNEMCLFTVRGCRPGKIVQMTEAEVRTLCLKSREIFLSQPILLELEAPLKICGESFSLWTCDIELPGIECVMVPVILYFSTHYI